MATALERITAAADSVPKQRYLSSSPWSLKQQRLPKWLARGPWAGLAPLRPVDIDLMSTFTCHAHTPAHRAWNNQLYIYPPSSWCTRIQRPCILQPPLLHPKPPNVENP